MRSIAAPVNVKKAAEVSGFCVGMLKNADAPLREKF
jgi:hypothetical protein